ncbi:hypothetical protein E2A64_04890 [Pseudohoeflea suaedae]|uniref:MAPEG family protein n=1 Tax=Pseudohoeflea suaedae TaxID=877384 RepID=A0A4R5PN29_9HYPH|nr:MAPEG family protein [Pseudohoeflea suaedae]TDH38450.1 hypothetical protein E2A64_04890 [Pseudohoeflea suaedae]
MTNTALFWPMIIQAALTFAVYIIMSRRRLEGVRRGSAKPADYKVPTVEPEYSATAVRNLSNQFELPVLFFVVCLSLQMTAGVNYAVLLLAWVFVISRLAHTIIHIGSNKLRLRRPIFIVGFLACLLLWIWLAVHLLMASL